MNRSENRPCIKRYPKMSVLFSVIRSPSKTGRKPGKCRRERFVSTAGWLTSDLVNPVDHHLHARNPERTVDLGGPKSIFVPMTGAPYLRDLEDERRGPTLDDLAMFAKLAHRPLPFILLRIVEPMTMWSRA